MMISSRFKSNKELYKLVLLGFCKLGFFLEDLDLHSEQDKVYCFCIDFLIMFCMLLTFGHLVGSGFEI